MQCHLCQRKLINISDDNHHLEVKLQCPEDHCVITYIDNKIINYSLLWDADSEAKERYWIDSYNDNFAFNKVARFEPHSKNESTSIYKSTYGRPYRYSKILELEYFIPLEIKNDIIQLNNVIKRLNNMKAFL